MKLQDDVPQMRLLVVDAHRDQGRGVRNRLLGPLQALRFETFNVDLDESRRTRQRAKGVDRRHWYRVGAAPHSRRRSVLGLNLNRSRTVAERKTMGKELPAQLRQRGDVVAQLIEIARRRLERVNLRKLPSPRRRKEA